MSGYVKAEDNIPTAEAHPVGASNIQGYPQQQQPPQAQAYAQQPQAYAQQPQAQAYPAQAQAYSVPVQQTTTTTTTPMLVQVRRPPFLAVSAAIRMHACTPTLSLLPTVSTPNTVRVELLVRVFPAAGCRAESPSPRSGRSRFRLPSACWRRLATDTSCAEWTGVLRAAVCTHCFRRQLALFDVQ
jgi:hypothetical protein